MEQKHSGLGIASFITSLFVFLLLVFGVMGMMGASTPGGINVGLFLIFFCFASLVALGLGIGGLIQKDRGKIYATLGTVFSVVTFVGTLSLLLVGLAMG